MKRGLRGLAVVLMALVAVACMPKHNGAVVADVSPAGWSADQSIELTYHNLDTLTKRRIWVVARAEADHNHLPLRVDVRCVSPDSVALRGSVVLRPTKHRGGSFIELRGVWIEQAVPALGGDYMFTLSHTEAEPIEQLWSVGIEVE